MKLRLLPALLSFFTALAIPAAHAATFVFTGNEGPVLTFSTDGLFDDAANYHAYGATYDFAYYYPIDSVTGDQMVAIFYGADEAASLAEDGFGDFDLEIQELNTGEDYFFDGPQLFRGSSSSPTFVNGTYSLTPDAEQGNGIGGTLVITGGAAAVAPEPSSLILLGTGALGMIGAARRRHRKASQ